MGIFTRIIGEIFGMLAAKPLTNALEKAMKTANEDEEVKAALADFQSQRQRTVMVTLKSKVTLIGDL